ncbi:MAG: PD-(D/E)XK nuclease family protein [Pelistega sp.]|nr:PD-(D/E)XK nuclease family protein [Pelistega sp.]
MLQYTSCTIEQLLTLPLDQVQIITANNRLAVFTKELILQRLQRKVVALPQITPYKAWLDLLAQQQRFSSQEVKIALDEFAQQWLWRQAIEHIEQDQPLLSLAQAAANASQAHRQLSEWAIEVRDDERSQEYERFLQWREQYQIQRDALGAWDTPQIIQASLQALQEGRIRVPKYYFISGFYALSPQQLSLLQTLQERGCVVQQLELAKQHASQISVMSAHDDKHEIESAVLWAKQMLIDHPDKHVALVCPDLQSDVAYVRRVLERHLRPAELAYHVAVGRPLHEWSLVRSLMQWLDLLASLKRNKVATSQFGKALVHACFGASNAELARLRQLDVELRKSEQVHWQAQQVLDHLYRLAPTFAAKFDQLYKELPEHKQGASDWAQYIRDCLTALEFPGPQALSSENFQVCQAFERVLKQLAALDEVLGQLHLEQVLTVLQQLLSRTIFQAKRAAQARLDVVGLYELEGGQWDAAWVMGLHDEALPSLAKPNPFIPVSSQRRSHVLHATPESEMQWSEQIFASILHAVPELILSWPQEKESQIMRQSSFISTWPQRELAPLPAYQAQVLVLEQVQDNQGLAAQPGDFRGGYRALDLQARNPLWAYANYRLGIEELLNYPSYELSHLNRGNFYHYALELVWKGLQNSANLHASPKLTHLLEQSVQVAAKEKLQVISSPVLRKLEQERAIALITELLAFEKNREEFVVEQMELRLTYELHGLRFNFTIDRIDRLADGTRVYIDYKTGGTPSMTQLSCHWFERERPIDVQLPLYASSLGQDPVQQIASVSFVSLKRGRVGYLGVGTHKLGLSKGMQAFESEKWQGIVQTWQDKLAQLVAELAQGVADNRYESMEDMRFCNIMPFLRCRVAEEGEGNE